MTQLPKPNLDLFTRFSIRVSRLCLAVITGCALLFVVGRALAADLNDPLLNLLLEKGMLSEDEAKKLQAEYESRRTNMVAMPVESKWKINNAIKSIELFGDLRTRFEDRRVLDPSGGKIDLQRFRYAVRLGLRGEVFDDFYYGVRLDTAANPRSAWVTFGTSSSGVPYQGPDGKSTAGINVGQVYMGWRGWNWLDVSVGKVPNPIYTTPMVWDPDLNPEGIVEKFKYTVGEADFFATLGQFLYQDVNPVRATPGFFNLGYNSSNPTFLLAWQAGVNYHITTNISAKVAPVFFSYTGHGVNGSAPGSAHVPDFSGTFVGQGSTNDLNGAARPGWSGFPLGFYDGFTANQTGINKLRILEIPFEANFRIWNLNAKIFGDYAYNFDGAQRAEDAYTASHTAFQPATGGNIDPISSPQRNDTHAYQAGLALGSLNSLGLVYGNVARKHAWEVRGYWQHVEQYSLDPNLIDSDFFEGRLNLEGFFAAAAYGFTDNLILTLHYGYANRINDKLGTGGSNQDIPQMNPIHHYNIFQADLTLKF